MAEVPVAVTMKTPLLESVATPIEAYSTESSIFSGNNVPHETIGSEQKYNSDNPQLHSHMPGIQAQNPNTSEEAYLIPENNMSTICGEYRVWESKYCDMV